MERWRKGRECVLIFISTRQGVFVVTRVLKKRIRNGVIGVAGLAPLVFKPRVFLLSYTKGPELQKKKKEGERSIYCARR